MIRSSHVIFLSLIIFSFVNGTASLANRFFFNEYENSMLMSILKRGKSCKRKEINSASIEKAWEKDITFLIFFVSTKYSVFSSVS